MNCDNKNSTSKNPINQLLRFLKVKMRMVGVKVSYAALLMFFAYNRADTPRWAKNIILGSIAYLVAPIDSVPDLTPFIGLTDDFGVLSFGLVSIACYINDDVRDSAKGKVRSLFKNVDEEDFLEVDAKL